MASSHTDSITEVTMESRNIKPTSTELALKIVTHDLLITSGIPVQKPEHHRPHSVSFSLPPTHDESHEKATGSRIPTAEHLSNGDYAINFGEVFITRKDGSKVLITDTKATYIPRSNYSTKDFILLKMFAFIGVIIFFPVGIPALVMTVIAQTSYNHDRKSGVFNGKGARAVRRAEVLVTVAVLLGFVLLGAIFIIKLDELAEEEDD